MPDVKPRPTIVPRSATPLHDEFLKVALDAIGPAVAAAIIGNKFMAAGVRLSARERQRLRQAIADNAIDQFSITRRKQPGASIEFTSADGDALLQQAGQLVERVFREQADKGSRTHASHVLKRLHDSWPSEADRQQREERGFRRRLGERWKHPFSLLRMLMTVYRESGETLANALIGTDAGGRPLTATVLVELHARSCQVLYEVVTLIEGGFADGAMARCRTLHEIAVTAMFLQQGDEELAMAYREHEVVESWKAVQKHVKYEDRLAEKPPSKRAQARLQARYDELVAKYGKEFKGPYGWATRTFKRSNVSFADIEAATNLDHLRPYYQLASHPIHANAKGLYFKLGAFEPRAMHALATNHGFAVPASSAAVSVVQTFSALLMLAPSLDAIVNARIVQKLADEVQSTLARTQRDEVRRLRKFDRESRRG